MARKERPLGWETHDVEGWEVLVGKTARDNDVLTFREAAPQDVWLHVGGGTPGSHVVIRNPEKGDVPRSVIKQAAELAATYSKARNARGKIDVHVCRVCDVSKPRGAKPGSVRLKRYESVKVYAAS